MPFLDQIDPYAYIDPWDIPSGPLEAFGFPTTNGSQSSNALFGELLIPILPRLNLQAALRYEDISQFEEDVNSRLAMRFDATARVRTRASWARGFRAPSPGEMHVGPSTKRQNS